MVISFNYYQASTLYMHTSVEIHRKYSDVRPANYKSLVTPERDILKFYEHATFSESFHCISKYGITF